MRPRLWFVPVCAGLVAALVATVFLSVSGASPCYEPGTSQFTQTIGQVKVDIRGQSSTHDLEGPTVIERRNPGDADHDGLQDIQVEIVSMQLVSRDGLIVEESAVLTSGGMIEQASPDACFAANSFFDVFFEIKGLGHNHSPARMSARINAIPPEGAVYESPPDSPVVTDLFLGPSHPSKVLPQEERIGTLVHARHIPIPEHPIFSVEAGGPTTTLFGLDPAHLYTITSAGGPPVVAIPKQALGLGNGDDLDALSFRPDRTDLRFSVRLGSQGWPGTDVNVEATKTPTEAHGDEFNQPGPAANQLFMDEGLFGLSLADDIDALAEPPPGLPIFFSLAPGSPTLGLIGATPGDILVSDGLGGPPAVAKAHGLLGLTPKDDLDGLCNFPPAGPAPELFSLAPGSPALAFLGAGAADLLNPGPVVALDAFGMGLLFEDDLDALKCGEVRFQPRPTPTPTEPPPTRCPEPLPPEQDFDGDGLSNDDERLARTDPMNPDTDGDGITDGAEVHTFKSDPLNPDENGNGILDGKEDRNNNGIPDGQECPPTTTPSSS